MGLTVPVVTRETPPVLPDLYESTESTEPAEEAEYEAYEAYKAAFKEDLEAGRMTAKEHNDRTQTAHAKWPTMPYLGGNKGLFPRAKYRHLFLDGQISPLGYVHSDTDVVK
jgi:hypothetical protein